MAWMEEDKEDKGEKELYLTWRGLANLVGDIMGGWARLARPILIV